MKYQQAVDIWTKLLRKIDPDVTIEKKHASGWKRMVSKNEKFLTETRSSLTKRINNGVHIFELELAFMHIEDIFRQCTFDIYTHTYTRTVWQSCVCAVAYSGQFMFWDDLIKLPATIAGIGRFYWNSVICFQLDVTLLMQNFVNLKSDIVWRSYKHVFRGLLFSWTPCIIPVTAVHDTWRRS